MAETLLITIDDVKSYRKISSILETERFEAFAIEAQRKNLRELLGKAFYYDFFENITAEKYLKLKDGDTYEYDGNTIKYYGLKPYLCYIWLAIFAREGDFFQANVGNMTWANNMQQNIQPISSVARKAMEQSYMESAQEYANDISRYLNENSSTYTLWEGEGEIKKTSFTFPDPI